MYQFFRRAEIDTPCMFEGLDILRNQKMCKILYDLCHDYGGNTANDWTKIEPVLADAIIVNIFKGKEDHKWSELAIISNFINRAWYKLYEASKDTESPLVDPDCISIYLPVNYKKFEEMNVELANNRLERKVNTHSFQDSEEFLENLKTLLMATKHCRHEV